MKLQIIETPDYILAVSDEKPTVGNQFIYETDTQTINTTCSDYTPNEFDFIIIAHQPKGNAPELDLPLLPEIVVEDDVETLYYKLFTGGDSKLFPKGKEHKKNWIVGYKAATKVYSEGDLRKAIELSRITYKEKTFGTVLPKYKPGEIVNLVTQPKTPKWFVAEHIGKCCGNQLINQCIDCKKYKPQLKTTTINGKTYLVGKYE